MSFAIIYRYIIIPAINFVQLLVSGHRACLADGVPGDREEGERSPHDRDQPGPDHDCSLGDLDLHHLNNGCDARHNQRGADEVLRLLLAAVRSFQQNECEEEGGGDAT